MKLSLEINKHYNVPGFHHMVKVPGEFALPVWKVLCPDCRQRYPGFKIVSFSEVNCSDCGCRAPIQDEKKKFFK